MHYLNSASLASLLAILAFAGSASAAEPPWGNLKARFVYGGKPPERAKIDVAVDREFCGKFEPRDESLVVDKEGGLAYVAVWLDFKADMPVIHPDYEKTADAKVFLDSRNCRFVPHMLTLRTENTLVIRNADPLAHNAHFDGLKNGPFNVLTAADKEFEFRLKEPERFPMLVRCDIHPWRRAWLMILDHPYMTSSDLQGNVSLAKLPSGKWTLRLWHEKTGWVKSAERGGEIAELPKGQLTVEIKPGENDLGEIKLSPELFVEPK